MSRAQYRINHAPASVYETRGGVAKHRTCKRILCCIGDRLIDTELSAESPAEPPQLIIIGECNVKLWNLGAAERHRRAFARVGVFPAPNNGRVRTGSIIAVRADYLLGPDLVGAIAARAGVILTASDREVAIAAHTTAQEIASVMELLRADTIDLTRPAPDGMAFVDPAELGPAYSIALRKRMTPLALSFTATPLAVLEEGTFSAAYKGATDFVTKWCWPRPALWATRWAAARGISPNSITTMSLLLVLLAMWLFAEGNFLAAIPIAWAMTFLDTVDGKLARVTLTSSSWGNTYDHGIDLIHPPFWWWAWYIGIQPMATPTIFPALEPALWIILVGYIVGRLLELLFVTAFKIQTHVWRPIDSFFRTITARRNPNLAILTVMTIVGYPDVGLVAVAGWTIISLIFHGVRLVQATVLRVRGEPIVSWLTQGR